MVTFSAFFECLNSHFACKWLSPFPDSSIPYANTSQPLIGTYDPLHTPVVCIDPSIDANVSNCALIILTSEKPLHFNIPTLVAFAKAHEIIEAMLLFCQKHLRPLISRHGVFMDIFGKGVFITGESGKGKSECALALLSKQHRLISDDLVYFYQSSQTLIGYGDPDFLGLLEIRDLAIIDVRQRFGPLSVMLEKPLDLIISLSAEPPLTRAIQKDLVRTMISNVSIPTLSFSLALKRDLAMLIESAVQFAFSPHTMPILASTESIS